MLVATKTDRDGERRQIRVPLHAPMRDDDIIQFLYCCPYVQTARSFYKALRGSGG